MKKLLKQSWTVIAVLIILAAILSSLFRALTPWATQYKSQVENHLSNLLGVSVQVKTMETGWYWFEPVIKLNQVTLQNNNKIPLKMDRLLVGIDLFHSLLHWRIQPGILIVDNLTIKLNQSNSGWQIEGLPSDRNFKFDPHSYESILAWLLAEQKIRIKNMNAILHLKDNSNLNFEGINLNVTNRLGHYRIKGAANLINHPLTELQIQADVNLNHSSFKKASGTLFFSVNNLTVNSLKQILPQLPIQILNGKGDIKLWADIKNGQLKLIQSLLKITNLSFRDPHLQITEKLSYLTANLSYKPLKSGFEIAADHLNLSLGKTIWPDNSMVLRYLPEKEQTLFFSKNLLLEPLFSIPISALKDLNKHLPHNLKGTLSDTKLLIKNHQIDYILTRFSNLEWEKNNHYPAVKNLSGVIHWQPTEGALELDSKETLVLLKDKPPLSFSVLNAGLEWKELNNGLHVSLDHFVLTRHNTVLSVQGVLDGISKESLGSADLKGQFYLKHAENLMTYLPSNYLKPKLEQWLKQDIKRIGKASGEFYLHGLLNDFPFDNKAGEFQVKTYLGGLDLYFAKEWPLARDLEAFLTVNKRNLNADILGGSLQELPIDKAQVRVDDLGLDKETLLIRARSTLLAQKALNFIQMSPLKSKLKALQMVKMEGPFLLDLQLEVPLYPQNDHVAALGDIKFYKNHLTVHHSLNDIDLDNLFGSLTFDESRILNSQLGALFLKNPVTINMNSVAGDKPATQVTIKGKTKTDVLQEKFHHPFLSLLKGEIGLEGVLLITDEPKDLDHLIVQTSLQGLAIDLPPPFGKNKNTIKPLKVDIDFNSNKALRLRTDYDNQLKMDLFYRGNKGHFELKKGNIQIGNTNKKPETGSNSINVIGSLPSFDLESWLKVNEKLQSHSSDSDLFKFDSLDLYFKKIKLYQEEFSNLSLKVKKLENSEWSFYLNQEMIAGNLIYQPNSNHLKGTLQKLELRKKLLNTKLNQSTSVKYKELPNLDILINKLKFDKFDLGEANIQTTATDQGIQLNNLDIKTPYYFLRAKGQWQKANKIDTTTVQAQLKISNLAKSLNQFNIEPVVEANRGEIYFQGGVHGPLDEVALDKLYGQLSISLRDGRVTHLDPETEEKLGLGKLLSILSLQTIPRRLKLDFSDLAEEGYSFDHFTGNFNVNKGIMSTSDSYVDGPVAYAAMKGNLDIARQYYDLDLKVSPRITASLPVVATIAGGPIAGLATWVASKIINQGMQKISGYTYKISGPWREPVVQQVKIIKEKKLQG